MDQISNVQYDNVSNYNHYDNFDQSDFTGFIDNGFNHLQAADDAIQMDQLLYNQVQYHNFDPYNCTADSFSATNENIYPIPCEDESLDTFGSASQYCPIISSYEPQYINYDTSEQGILNQNPPQSIDTSQSQMNQCSIFRFEIPGFDIIIKPKSNSTMDLNNLDTQYQLQQDQSYPYSSSQLNPSQNYISENSVNPIAMNVQNHHIIHNDNICYR
ncbi:12999_t:CDS:1 [Funneliformis geosporum]|uniref:16412_t:CDS:1 n=1 Tax=Funneliformis geosporum TaxID=1117311 RepID=A0A9W4SD92_9GLOM|nr:16412_t:CDS:1 [Funneliformis geosporum]CAI2182156.1 12999_t:CDS:1 [Funneliformis geosporum]